MLRQQGLNYIAGLLLLVTKDEELSYFLLRALTENLLPEYYGPNIPGLLTDVRVFSEILRFVHATNEYEIRFNVNVSDRNVLEFSPTLNPSACPGRWSAPSGSCVSTPTSSPSRRSSACGTVSSTRDPRSSSVSRSRSSFRTETFFSGRRIFQSWSNGFAAARSMRGRQNVTSS